MNARQGPFRSSIRRNIGAGVLVALLLVGSVAGWAFNTDIAGAVIAPGSLVVDSSVRKIQHPTGGVVSEILARDGDRVRTGDVLLRLDATVTRANLAIVSNALDQLVARKARLEAERDDFAVIPDPQGPVPPDGVTAFAQVVAGERQLFELRRAARIGQKAQLDERVAQLRREVEGLEAQIAAKQREIELIGKELEGARELWQKNLMPITKLTQLEREATRLAGERGQLVAASAQANGRIAETQLQIVQVDRDLASEVARELRDTDAKIAEYRERQIAAEQELKRIDLRSPIDGVVHQSTVHTVGGVVTAGGEPLMLIVPQSDRLMVEARVSASERDQLYPGQPALLRFLTFNQRNTPELHGTVSRISPDAVTDQRTGAAFYTVRVALGADEIARLGEVEPVPGMPVETFIMTGERKVISYLMKPLTDQLARTFR